MQKTKLKIVLLVVAVGVAASAFAAFAATRTISNNGQVHVVGINVYWDSSCTNEVSSIGWGILQPGESKTVTIYVQNEGSSPVVLNMTTHNWTPASASSDLGLNWNREAYVLPSATVVEAVFTLSVASNVDGLTDFSFDITITGTES
ncbi:MAG: hypothetical protein JSW72_04020 [Candidatus Bathyarchaeota archaeon]|nr:MAG: hypothetical protein JSW72_04020 [Candidatus Bathyarchaeota archaeon]